MFVNEHKYNKTLEKSLKNKYELVLVKLVK